MRKLFAALVLVLFMTGSTYSKEPSAPPNYAHLDYHSVIIDLDLSTPKPLVPVERPAPIASPVVITVLKLSDPKAYALSRIGATQFACLDQLWTHESHWNPLNLNRLSGAYGIPQALPGSKMAVMGADWKTNPITQVKWGLMYIKARYGTACNAWKFWQEQKPYGWY